MKELEELNGMIAEVGEIATKHGWNDASLSDMHCLMMIVTEIAEAIQADRNGSKANVKAFKEAYKEDDGGFIFPDDLGKQRSNFMSAYEKYMEGTVEGELADIVIRILSFLAMRNLRLTSIEEMTESEKDASMGYFDDCSFTEAALDLTYSISKHYDGDYTDKSLADDLTHSVAFVLEWARYLNADLLEHIKLKTKYNSMREYKHGKKY